MPTRTWVARLQRPTPRALDALASSVQRWRQAPRIHGHPPEHWEPHPGWERRPPWLLPWRRLPTIRRVWERHRLLHVQRLALAECWLGDAQAGRLAREEVASWQSTCGVGRGVGWASSLEVAHRLVSLLLLRSLWHELDVDDHLVASGEHLATHPSLGSSLGNHTVGEAAALVTLACLAPTLPKAERWRALGLRRLQRGVEGVIGVDGSGREQAPAYTAAVLEWGLLARAAHGPLPVDPLLARAARALGAWCSHGAPRRGDDDDSAVLDAGGVDSLRSIAGCAAAVFDVPPPPGWRMDGRSALLGVRRSLREPAMTTATTAGWTTISRTLAGQGWSALIGLGPTGMAPLASHGHDDGGSVWLTIDGVPIIVDRGTPAYGGDLRRRSWCRGAAAHSTPLLDGEGPALPRGVFDWDRTGLAVLQSRTAECVSLELRGWPKARVQRRVRLDDEGLEVRDRVIGRRPRRVEVWVHLPRGAVVRVEPWGALVQVEGRVLRLESACELRVCPTLHAFGQGQFAAAPSVCLQAREEGWGYRLRPTDS